MTKISFSRGRTPDILRSCQSYVDEELAGNLLVSADDPSCVNIDGRLRIRVQLRYTGQNSDSQLFAYLRGKLPSYIFDLSGELLSSPAILTYSRIF